MLYIWKSEIFQSHQEQQSGCFENKFRELDIKRVELQGTARRFSLERVCSESAGMSRVGLRRADPHRAAPTTAPSRPHRAAGAGHGAARWQGQQPPPAPPSCWGRAGVGTGRRLPPPGSKAGAAATSRQAEVSAARPLVRAKITVTFREYFLKACGSLAHFMRLALAR